MSKDESFAFTISLSLVIIYLCKSFKGKSLYYHEKYSGFKNAVVPDFSIAKFGK